MTLAPGATLSLQIIFKKVTIAGICLLLETTYINIICIYVFIMPVCLCVHMCAAVVCSRSGFDRMESQQPGDIGESTSVQHRPSAR